jgi:hypothetical protein
MDVMPGEQAALWNAAEEGLPIAWWRLSTNINWQY